MNGLLNSTAILLASFALLAPAAQAVDIPQGAHVLLRMENSLSTSTAKQGDYVYLRTAVPIASAGDIAVPAGSYVQGVVTEAKRSGRVKGRAQLAIRLETLTLASGKVYKFAPHLAAVDAGDNGQKVVGGENTVEQAPGRGRDAERIAILAGSGAAVGGLADRSWKGAGIGAGVGSAVGLATVLLTRGKEVELRQGSTLDVVFDRPVSLQ
jgi:type IV secretion system protein VirB10